jgi:hypothetical protein
MGGEWSKAVGMIFKQKYSKGRGKLQDAMKDPDTKVLHEQLKSGKKVKVGKTRKMRGGAEVGSETEHSPEAESKTEHSPEAESKTEHSLEAESEASSESDKPVVSSQDNNSKSLEERVAAIEALLRDNKMMKGGFPAKSKKSRKVKSRRN